MMVLPHLVREKLKQHMIGLHSENSSSVSAIVHHLVLYCN